MRYSSMVRVALKRSMYLTAVLTAVHLACAGIVIPLELPLWAKLGLGACISLSLGHSLLRHGFLRTGAALLAIELREYDSASVETPDGQWQEARVLPTTYVSALLTVINVRVPPGVFARHMVIAPDSTDPESFRRLRVWLRWKYRQAE